MKQFPDGSERFKKVADQVKQQVTDMTVPGVDAAISDHVSQTWQEHLAPIYFGPDTGANKASNDACIGSEAK
jgi:hypothetical protein